MCRKKTTLFLLLLFIQIVKISMMWRPAKQAEQFYKNDKSVDSNSNWFTTPLVIMTNSSKC